MKRDSKILATKVQSSARSIRNAIGDVIAKAVEDAGELAFLQELLATIDAPLQSALQSAGVTAKVRTRPLHQKPYVTYTNASNARVKCELGDLLVVVKYLLPGGTIEARSIVFQLKSARPGTYLCDISPSQLELLWSWPDFEFGWLSPGVPQRFAIRPMTLECGSYMLMLREPKLGDTLPYRDDAGVVPSAWRVKDAGSSPINIETLPFTLSARSGLFNIVAFASGEPHETPGMQLLVNALYRFCGWAPDPPDEFNGFYESYPNVAFGIIEVAIAATGSNEARALTTPPQ